MGAIFVSDFKFGMDRRRPRICGIPGTLWDAKNVVINRGGDIERARRFVPTYTLPDGQTFGCGSVLGQVYVFGSVANPGVPLGVQYQQLVAPSGALMTRVLDVQAAGGSLYVIASYADGNTYHFYNGVRVSDWDTVADSGFTYTSLATYMAGLLGGSAAVTAVPVGNAITISAVVPGVPFTITRLTTDIGGISDQDITLATPQANVAAVTEVLATTNITVLNSTADGFSTIANITINGVNIMLHPVAASGNTTTDAAAIATQINNSYSTPDYTAVASGPNITVTPLAGTGATPNGYAVLGVVTGSSLLSTPSMSGGVSTVAPMAQISTATFIGTPQSTDVFTLIVNGISFTATGRASATGTSGYVYKRRIFSPANSLWEYCAINTFTDWHSTGASSGAGFFNISNEAQGAEPLVGTGTYIGQSAIFSRRNCRIFNMSTDATQIALAQAIDNTGARSSRSILAYGTTDLLYLDETGVRSLKARDASGEAFVSDIGVAIDPFIQSWMDGLSDAVVSRACSVVEPRDGRYWLAVGSRIFVLSFFPGSNISAWTYFDPGFVVSDFARAYNHLYVRSGDTIYLYGGPTGLTYPNAGELIADVELPFAASTPPGQEDMLGFDMAAVGEWTVKALIDPNNEASTINVGVLDGNTYSLSDEAFPGRTTHVAASMTCSASGAARISNITIRTTDKEVNG